MAAVNAYSWPDVADFQVSPVSLDVRMPSPTAQTSPPWAAMAPTKNGDPTDEVRHRAPPSVE